LPFTGAAYCRHFSVEGSARWSSSVGEALFSGILAFEFSGRRASGGCGKGESPMGDPIMSATTAADKNPTGVADTTGICWALGVAVSPWRGPVSWQSCLTAERGLAPTLLSGDDSRAEGRSPPGEERQGTTARELDACAAVAARAGK